jgi:hypothetical protein
VSELHDRESTSSDVDQADQFDDEAIDFSLVHADDEFLDALGAAQPDQNGEFADDKRAALLLSWRHDVDDEPIPELVDPKLAVVTVQAARIRQRRGPRLLAPIAAAAAVLAIVFAGVGLAARDAQPGDTLWGLTRVLYADHARSVEAAAAVRVDLRDAEEALAKGRVAEAKTMLDEARHTLPTVSTEDGKADLQAQHEALVAKLPGNPAVDPASPPAANPTTAPTGGTTAPTSPSTPPADTSTTNPTVPTNPTTDPTSPTTSSTTSEPPGRIETETSNGGTPGTGPANIPEAPNDDNPAEKPASTEP